MAVKSQLDVMLAKVDADIEQLLRYRAWLLDAAGPAPVEPKTRRGRGKNKPKPGLPTGGDTGE